MEQLIELLTQIQDLAGMGIEALQQAASGEGADPESAPEGEAGPPAEQPPA